LIIDAPRTANRPGGRVLRAPKPDFTTVTPFIPAFEDQATGGPFLPVGLAVNSAGDVFVTDFTNGKVLRYSSDGTFQGTFAQVTRANQIAIDPEDNIYVTNATFQGAEAIRGSLFVYDQAGNLITTMTARAVLRGVTICAETQS
jgi:sugar lactone lactonase YvrE